MGVLVSNVLRFCGSEVSLCAALVAGDQIQQNELLVSRVMAVIPCSPVLPNLASWRPLLQQPRMIHVIDSLGLAQCRSPTSCGYRSRSGSSAQSPPCFRLVAFVMKPLSASSSPHIARLSTLLASLHGCLRFDPVMAFSDDQTALGQHSGSADNLSLGFRSVKMLTDISLPFLAQL